MIRTRLEGGPYDGYEGDLTQEWLAQQLAFRPCPPRCQCGKPIHAAMLPCPDHWDYVVYTLHRIDDTGAVYRYGDGWPSDDALDAQRPLEEALA